ncbi:hypothetical protein [Fischerella sp. PCC 9605]|nr:hypothetical protein [Fischerella sp. PCC 9605]
MGEVMRSLLTLVPKTIQPFFPKLLFQHLPIRASGKQKAVYKVKADAI